MFLLATSLKSTFRVFNEPVVPNKVIDLGRRRFLGQAGQMAKGLAVLALASPFVACAPPVSDPEGDGWNGPPVEFQGDFSLETQRIIEGTVRKQLQNIDPAFYEGLTEIIFRRSPDGLSGLYSCETIYISLPPGAVNPATDNPYLLSKVPENAYDFLCSDWQKTLLHEIGHHVFTHLYNLGHDSNIQQEFIDFSWAKGCYEAATGVALTDYAYNSCREDFAESFAYYIWRPAFFREAIRFSDEIRKKYEFLKKHIFFGVEYDEERGSYEVLGRAAYHIQQGNWLTAVEHLLQASELEVNSAFLLTIENALIYLFRNCGEEILEAIVEDFQDDPRFSVYQSLAMAELSNY
ncbi:MAG: hypothetical protein ABH823_02030 [bacterium]